MIDTSQALAPWKLIFTGDWTSLEQDEHKSSARDTYGIYGSEGYRVSYVFIHHIGALESAPTIVMVVGARSSWMLTSLATDHSFSFGVYNNPTHSISGRQRPVFTQNCICGGWVAHSKLLFLMSLKTGFHLRKYQNELSSLCDIFIL